jgi:GAF domain-containing protein
MSDTADVATSYSRSLTHTGTWRPWLEAAVGLAAAFALPLATGWRLPGLDFPAVAVALVAARYGYGPGAGAGAVAGTVHLALAGLGPLGTLAVFGDRGALGAAFVYVALGAAVGLVGDGPREAARRAAEALDRLGGNHERLRERYDVMLAAKEAVDRRIVGQVQTVASLYEAARELETLVPGKIPGATLRLLARYLEVEAASIYRLEAGRLVLAEAIGEHPDRPESLDPASHPLGRALAGQARLPGATAGEPAAALLAATLTHPDGRPRGVIAIEKLPFRQLTPATAQMLTLFADWASRALANSEAYVQARELQRDHPQTGLHRVQPLLDRVHQEWAAARRYKLALSVILVRQPGLADADDAAWEAGASAIAKRLLAAARNVDVVGHHRTRDTFLMLLPVTPLAGARVLAGRLEAALGDCIVVAAANEEGHADAEALLQALQAAAFGPLPEVRHAG